MLKYKNEIRGIFFHASNSNGPNWNSIATVLSSLDVNFACVEAGGNNYARWSSTIIPTWWYDMVKHGSEACHSIGIDFGISLNLLLSAYTGDGIERRVLTCNSDGSSIRYTNWLCPTNPFSRSLLKSLVEELFSKYTIDVFVFDYIRYDTREMCFCSYCENSFKTDTGLIDASFPIDVIESGKYSKEFVEWRTKPITELVRDIRNWILAVNSDVEFGVAAWNYCFNGGYPTYWRYWIGQDTNYWIKEGYVDFISPMIYTDSTTALNTAISCWREHGTGGPEGKVLLVPFIDTCVDEISTPDNFKERVNLLRRLGVDGWIVWRYGGPGDGQDSGAPDIRNYLSGMNSFPVWEIQNIQVKIQGNQGIITWETSEPTTGRIEYSSVPLFYGTIISTLDFQYWKIIHNPGTTIEDTIESTRHTIVLSNLSRNKTYYYRIQSVKSNE